MIFTDDVVDNYLNMRKLDTTGTNEEKRKRLATFMTISDPVAGWQVETGRPWNEMTRDEAQRLVMTHPKLVRNPNILSRLGDM